MARIPMRAMHLWHGERDRLTPAGPARRLAQRLAVCNATFFAEEGHFSTLVRHARDIFEALRRDVAVQQRADAEPAQPPL
jgi:hypothetical protein